LRVALNYLIEFVGCKYFLGKDEFLIFVVYFPRTPSLPKLTTFCNYFEHNFVSTNNIIILGDFNIPQFIQKDKYNCNLVTVINRFSQYLSLKQFNDIKNLSHRLLDLVFSSLECVVIHDSTPFVNEDLYHPALSISVCLSTYDINFVPSNTAKTYNFKRANYDLLYQELLATDWSFLNYYSEIDVIVDKFYKYLYNVLDKHVPVHNTNNRKNNKFPCWFTSSIINNIKLKYDSFRKFKNSNNAYYYQRFGEYRRLIKRQIASARVAYLSSVQNNIRDDPRKFWSYINSKKGVSRIPGRVTCNGDVFEAPQNIVDAFASFFQSVFIASDPDPLISGVNVVSGSYLNIIQISEADISAAIALIKNSFTAGHDQIPAFLVKDCKTIFIQPLLTIFNASLRQSKFPFLWKISKIIPVFKNGDRSIIDNYRPISILSNFSKIFEIVLYSYIYPYITNFISPQQHGFLKKRSTVTNLACFSQYVSESINQGSQVDTIYTDFAKAFDRVDHRLIISKLDMFGISNKVLHLLQSYLFNRQQFVSYNGFSSFLYHSTSGIPQGSNLGPLLFICFINDLPSALTCGSLLYADDNKMYSTINNLADALTLQENLNRLSSWCIINKLALNVSKCKVVSYSYKKSPLLFNYHIDNLILKRENTIKDLGIYFDERLNFNYHIDIAVNKALSMLGFIIRNSRDFTNIEIFQLLFKTYVIPCLEYACLVWNPFYQCHVTSIEAVQRKFLIYLHFKVFGVFPLVGTHNHILREQFNFLSSANRRKIIILLFLHKLIHYRIDCADLLQRLCFCIPRVNNRNVLPLYAAMPRSNTLLRAPIQSMSNLYNAVCKDFDIYYVSGCYFRKSLTIYFVNKS
jgi:hypothetical protein